MHWKVEAFYKYLTQLFSGWMGDVFAGADLLQWGFDNVLHQ